MELHPVLECGELAKTNLWYVISSSNAPCARVGQACMYFGPEEIEDKSEYSIIVVGGADPSTVFQDTHILNLKSFKWSKVSSDLYDPRYEHCGFVPTSDANSVLIFGGAKKSNNLNTIQRYNKDTDAWSDVKVQGTPPSPRTLHSVASQGDLLYVWGGGYQGPNPVPDLKIHVFDASSSTWTQPDMTGTLPSARHGHVIIAINQSLFIHGGMTGTTFHKGLFQIDLENSKKLSCAKVKTKGDIPSGRAAHAACCYGNTMYIFGGMSEDGALDDMYSFNTVSKAWTLMTFDSPPPTPRLDHSMVCVMLPVFEEEEMQAVSPRRITNTNIANNTMTNVIPVDIWQGNVDGDSSTVSTPCMGGDAPPNTASEQESNEPDPNRKIISHLPACLVYGGMDTSGNLFNDVLVTVISTKT